MKKKARPSKPSPKLELEKRKPGKPPGRTNFLPTLEQRNMVEAMAGFVMPDDEICRLVLHEGTPITETTLKTHFREELSNGRAKIRMRHHMALFKNVETGNVTAQIWWDKTRNHVNEQRFPSAASRAIANAAAEVKQLEPEMRTSLDVARRIAFVLFTARRQQQLGKPAT